MEVLRRDLNLKIDDLDQNKSKAEAVRNYHVLLDDYMVKRGVMNKRQKMLNNLLDLNLNLTGKRCWRCCSS